MMTRIILRGLATAAAFAIGLTPFAASAQDRPFEGVTLSVLMEGHPTTDAVQAMLPDFEEMTGITVEMEVVPEADVTSKMLLEMSTASGRYDVVENNIIFIPGFAENDYIIPFDPYLEQFSDIFDRDDFVPGYFGTNLLDGQVWGLPVFGESSFVMYRTDLYEQHGLEPPATFEAMRESARVIHEATDGEIVGITMRGLQGIQSVYIWAAYLWGHGGSFLDADGNSNLATPEAIRATEEFASVLNSYGPVGVANYGWEENRLLFQQGKAALTLDATVNGAYNEDPSVSEVVGKVGYLPVPQIEGEVMGGSSSLGVHSLYIPSASKNPAAAALFVIWMTAPEQQLRSVTLVPNSGVTSLTAMNSEAFVSRYGAFREGMIAAVNNGNPQFLPTVPQANEIINNAGIAVSKVLAGVATAEEALMEADEANNRALSR